ncbi:MAG: thiamine pyrophosphate-binding protein [Deltaproteobacteria bacterium]|nr:thiamine pyrophosphate-binding protein [Deltaproteobacteria bacterium]
MKLNGGQILGRTLKAAGVETIFGLVGHGNIGLIDGIVDAGISFVSCHHETVAGMAADGYFRATGKPGVVCLTCAPGALNAQLAVNTAAQDHSAVVYIVGDIPMKFAGKGTYEEVDLHGPDDQFHLLKPNFKRAWKVVNLELMSQFVANALNAAQTGCPGPVLLDVPFDLDTQEVDTELVDAARFLPRGRPQGEESLLEEAAEMLFQAERAVLLAGGGVNLSRSSEALMQLSKALDAPIVSSIMGASAFCGTYEGFAGFIGSYGTELANDLVREADVLFAVGTRFEEEETAIWLDGEVLNVPPTHIIQLDIDPMVIGKNYPVDIGIVGDAAVTLSRLRQMVEDRAGGKAEAGRRLGDLAKGKREWLEKLSGDMDSDQVPLNPRRILRGLGEQLPEDAILTVDCSWSRIGLLQQLGQPGPDRCYIVGGVLPIGWSTSAALGVAAGRPPSRVVAVTGDGGFLMSIQSLLTAAEYDLPITWLIINNGGYNALDVLQRVYFGGRSVGSCFKNDRTGVDLTPDFSAIAQGFHVPGERVTSAGEIDGALERGLQAQGPYLIDFICDPNESRLIRTAQVTWSYFWSTHRAKEASDKVG